MKKIVALSLAIAAVSIAPSAFAAPAEVSHNSTSGAFASVQSFEGNGYSSLEVFQSGAPGSESTFLQLYSSSCTYTTTSFSCSGSTAWGQIPNGDFAVHGSSGNADLSTDATNLVGSTYSYGCDYSTWTCSFQDTPFVGGFINVTWDKTSEYSFASEGKTEVDYLNYKFVNQGKSSYGSASAEGNVLGVSVASQDGQVGTNDSMMRSIVKNY
jgi:hypothetical protein